MDNNEAITELRAMLVEARRYLAIALREHQWASTVAKWRNRRDALDKAIRALQDREDEPPAYWRCVHCKQSTGLRSEPPERCLHCDCRTFARIDD